jgi:hypothetical protein
MTKTRNAFLPLLVTVAAVALAATGCAPAVNSPGPKSASNQPAAAASKAPTVPQHPLKGVPTKCMTKEDVSAAVHQLFNGVYPSTINGALVCEYYVDGNSGSPVVSMNFEPYKEGSAADWLKQALARRPGAKSVFGSADGAIYFVATQFHEFDFISGSTVCNITASPIFDEVALANLPEFLLED